MMRRAWGEVATVANVWRRVRSAVNRHVLPRVASSPMLPYNLASISRNELEDVVGGCWDLHRFQTYVLQAGARLTKHARRLIVHVALSVQGFWTQLAHCISRWKLPDRFRPARGPRPRKWRPTSAHAHQPEVLRS
jgi:hypothetical protein